MSPSRHLASESPFRVRRAGAGDRHAVLDLATRALGWDPTAPNESFFAWKHEDNPFGASPLWLALDGDRLAGFRVFLRWRFRWADGEVWSAVRAVDTATDPDYQRRGIFSLLTRNALDELRDEQVACVFNTPNDKSRPGYLKMGWEVVGRVPLAARVASLGGARRLLGARVPADKWSEPIDAGEDPTAVFADPGPVETLIESSRPSVGLATDRTPEYLSWRYAFGPLRYRAFTLGSSVERGVVVVRRRRRGPATELAVAEVLVPRGDRTARRRLLGIARRAVPHDYAVLVRGPGEPRCGFLPAPGQGPVLTWRGVANDERPPARLWNLALGDIELF